MQLVDLERRHLPGRYDLPHLQEFHRFLFGDIYGWAGELRTVTIAKADLFCLPENIASFSQDVFRALDRDDFLRGRERAEFVVGLAEHLANVNAVHPFREGNGRTQRAFFGQRARDAGYRIDWSTMDRETNLAASRASIRGNEAQLRAMLDRLVDQPGE